MHWKIKSILSRLISSLVLKIFRVQIIGQENIPYDSNYIIVSNHSSKLDSFLLNNISITPPRFLANKGLYDNWYFFILAYLFNIISMRHSRDISAFRECFNTLNQKIPIVIFPEGELSMTEAMSSWKKGAEYIAKQTNTQILPIAIIGANKAWSPNSYLPKFCEIKIYISQAISPEVDSPLEISRKRVTDFLNYQKI